MVSNAKKSMNKQKKSQYGIRRLFFLKTPGILFLFTFAAFLAACSPVTMVVPTQNIVLQETETPEDTLPEEEPLLLTESPSAPLLTPEVTLVTPDLSPSATEYPVLEPTEMLQPEFDPETWVDLPVIPEISDNVLNIYAAGVEYGRDPSAFSKIGDCESSTTWYLADFDLGEEYYNLGEYVELEGVIEHYSGSYGRLSLAAGRGFTTASIFSPLWSDAELCESNEEPLACEYRIHNPSVALITLGTNDASKFKSIESFEENMRQIIEYTIDQGIIPVLATKADNAEGDNSFNRLIAVLAYEYDIPLWNFWAAAQPLYHQGLQDDDRLHLTWAKNDFSDPVNMQNAWPVRNLTALQMLDAVWTKIYSASE